MRARKAATAAGITLKVRSAEPRKARVSSRKARAEARAAARQARAAAVGRKVRVTVPGKDMAASVAPSGALTLLGGLPQTTVARAAQELADLTMGVGLDIHVATGPILLSQLNEADGADLAILQSDALDDALREGGGTLQRKLTFIARLFNQEVHIIARQGVKTFADLDGRTIASSATATPEGRTAAKLFERAGLHPRLLDLDPSAALARLGRGEIDAAIFIGGKPVPALGSLPVAGLHLVSIPYTGALQDFYYPAQITKADYPDLVPDDNGVMTVAIGTVLVALDAKPGSARSKKLTQLTQIFFDRFGALRDSGHHPKWGEVNLAADVPGWRRFQPAQAWLDQKAKDPIPAPRVSSVN